MEVASIERSEEFLEPLKIYQKINSVQLYYWSQEGGFPDEVKARRAPGATSLYLQVDGLPNSLTLFPPTPVSINHSARNTKICSSLKLWTTSGYYFLSLSCLHVTRYSRNEPLVFLLKK